MRPPVDTTIPSDDPGIVDVDAVEVEPLDTLVTWATSTLLISARMYLTSPPRARHRIVAPVAPPAS